MGSAEQVVVSTRVDAPTRAQVVAYLTSQGWELMPFPEDGWVSETTRSDVFSRGRDRAIVPRELDEQWAPAISNLLHGLALAEGRESLIIAQKMLAIVVDALPRSQEQILARIAEVTTDILGTERWDLVECLDFDRARTFFKDDVTREQWDKARGGEPTTSTVRSRIADYLSFAIGKCTGHRGLSAGRSVAHLRAWFWLLGDDEMVDFIDDDANYPQYGAPILAEAARRVDFDFRAALDGEQWEMFERMAQGKLCCSSCNNGCGL